jgi:hypothetical protein
MKLVKLFLLFVLFASLAKADGLQPNTVYLLDLDPRGPIAVLNNLDIGAGLSIPSPDGFQAPLPLAGGLVAYTGSLEALPGPDGATAPIGSKVSGFVDVLAFCQGISSVVQFPPGYVDDPTLPPIERYPFDNCFGPVGGGGSDPQLLLKVASNDFRFVPGTYDGLLVTGASVPEPGTLTFLLAGFGALVVRKRPARRN